MGSQASEWATEPIAIIGLSCRLAGGASNPEKLWEMLAEGRSAWSEVPPDRWIAKGAYHPNPEKLATTFVKGAHFLKEDVSLFDAAFFNYSAETAAALDPQYRLQLETTYEALENAGLPLSQVAGSNTSVFTGIFTHDYHEGIIRDDAKLPRFLPIGTFQAMSANRISHFFDFRGASMTLDTGCSAGLVALHQAVKSLRDGEADMSVVSGCNLMLNPDVFKSFSSLGLLSPEGKSYAFDSRANGYGRGEGVTTLVIKRLKDALAARDPIRAVIRETGLNQDGKTETITSPSESAQEELIRLCYSRAGLDPSGTQYFEAHGTGTPAGDPIEARSIAAVFGGPQRKKPLLVGSIKTNIGHTEAVSGLASLAKVVLSMEHGHIPPSINFDKPNPKLKLDEWRLEIARTLEPWPAISSSNGQPRRASVNNFGYGGSNSHIIVEDANAWLLDVGNHKEPPTDSDAGKVLLLSARDEQACRRMASDLKEYLQKKALKNPSPSQVHQLMQNLCYTLGERRSLFPWVAACPVSFQDGSLQGVIDALDSAAFKPTRSSPKIPRVGMVFTGQGAQWNAMGRELFTSYPVFKDSIDEAEQQLKSFGAQWSLIEELHRDAHTTKVNTTAFSIPICVAVQIALVRLLKSWGITPTAVTSHSSGEIAAAYTVGALTMRQAMAAAYFRAIYAANPELRVKGERGGMVAVGLGQEDAQELLDKLTAAGRAVIACINSPASVTVAGDVSAVEEMEKVCTEQGIFARRLKVETGYHCHHMDPIAAPYADALEKELATREADDDDDEEEEEEELSVAFSSPVTGGRITSAREIARPEHWVGSLLQPVQFVEAFTDMVLGDGLDPSGSCVDVILEVGPHTALGGPIREILSLPEFENLNIPYYGCLVRKENASTTVRLAAINLLREGLPINMSKINFPRGPNPNPPRVLSDLPPYPWNHTTRHWLEARMNRTIRALEDEPHDLLGSLVPGAMTTSEVSTWRNVLRPSELPWLRDHCVQGSMVYPGAGYVVLAIEAVKRLTSSSDKPVAAYRLRDVDIMAALVIPDGSDGIEVQTTLRDVSDRTMGVRGWKRFEVVSVTSDNRWTTHAQGLITPELTSSSASIGSGGRPTATMSLSGYTRHVDPQDLWANLRAQGIVHGPKFQNIPSIVQDGRSLRSLTRVVIPDVSVPKDLRRRHVIHPTTLDSIIVAAYATLPPASTYDDAAAKVPRSIQSLWVSSDMISAAGHQYTVDTTLAHVNSQTLEADSLCVVDESSNTTVFEMRGLVCQSLGAAGGGADADKTERRNLEKDICSSVEWAADLSLGQPEAILQQLRQHVVPSDNDEQDLLELFANLKSAVLYFCQDALNALTPKDVDPKYTALYSWICELVAHSGLGSRDNPTPERRQRQINLAVDQSVDGELILLLGRNLIPILKGETDINEFVSEEKADSLARRYLSQSVHREPSFTQLGNLLRLLAHKNPQGRVLEINAASGGATRHILRRLSPAPGGGPPLVGSWHYTDVSSKSFEDAKDELAEWSDVLEFAKLDIDKDLTAQGFIPESYDVIVASSLLDSTRDAAGALSRIHSLLKPGGTLLLTDAIQDHPDVCFLSSLLPSLFSLKDQPPSPKQLPSLQALLQEAGFTGIDVSIPDSSNSTLNSRIAILSTVRPTPKLLPSEAPVLLVMSNKCPPPPSSFLESLRAQIKSPTQVVTLETAGPAAYANKISIFLGELSEPLLHALDQVRFAAIQQMAIKSKGLLWLTRGGAVDCEIPEQALAQGFLRALRNEYVGRRYMLLDLDPHSAEPWSDKTASAISTIVEAGFGQSQDSSFGTAEAVPTDFEYAERGGVLLVPRLYKDVERNNTIGAPPASNIDWQAPGNDLQAQPLFQDGRPLRLKVGIPGLLDTIAFGDDEGEFFGPDFAADAVEISPRAYGVNFRDVMVAMGQLKERVMGLECAGVITRLGSEAQSRGDLRVGDRVMALLLGPFTSQARATWHTVSPIPHDMSFEDAASLPVIFCTVYHGLVDVARLQSGQSILIHAGAGGVGQAALMLAKHLGVTEVYVTVGSQEKRELIKQKYGVPGSHIFNSRDTSFGPAILKATKGRGVDVVLNSLAGPLLQTSFDVLAPLGRFIEIGKRELESNSLLEMAPFSRATSYAALDLLTLIHHRRDDVHRILGEVSRLVQKQVVTPIHPVTAYPIQDAAKAFRLLQTGKHTGKVVLTANPGDLIKVLARGAPKAQLRPDASYILVGGVGGIGRSIAHWMVDHGARNLILLSRSAGDATKTGSFVEELKQLGCRTLAVSCDVANAGDLAKALRRCEDEGLPPVRGVINGAMALHDAILEQMTFGDRNASIRPKVAATWNLHTEFSEPESLDFFVMLSSLSGILGLASQSNYGAGGTYQDAVAHWRQARGLPAVSLDLGAVKGVGYVAETSSVANRMRKAGDLLLLAEDVVLRAVESAVLHPLDGQPQVLIGLNAGPGAHWDVEGQSQLGRDARYLPLKHRKPRKDGSQGGSQGEGGQGLAAKLVEVTSHDEATRLVGKAIADKLADIFMIPAEEIDLGKPPAQYGVDSLVAVELRNMLALQAAAEVSIFSILQSASLAALAGDVVAKSPHIQIEGTVSPMTSEGSLQQQDLAQTESLPWQ
ncbi:hypothetical protein QBC42DRAFT_344189 [Cladorrhinum samala]|uniref:Polyketide synthase n=1 Tax=Cladorrhinum samala TaxID=585594 RepID=A0AAV9HWT4_9PEZI|nr:hypothetical protein QBC42DRAFT_344189 [Cladorrhinum samala]